MTDANRWPEVALKARATGFPIKDENPLSKFRRLEGLSPLKIENPPLSLVSETRLIKFDLHPPQVASSCLIIDQ